MHKLSKEQQTLVGAAYTKKYEKLKGISKNPQSLERSVVGFAERQREHLARIHNPTRTTRRGTPVAAPTPVPPVGPPGKYLIAIQVVMPAQQQANALWLNNPIAGGGFAAPGDNLFTTPDGIPLLRSSLRRLLPSRWLNDEVVNACVELFRHKGGNPHIAYLGTSFFQKLARANGPSGVDRYTTCERATVLKEGVKFVVCPINVGGSHWVVLLIDLMGRNLQYFDSLGGDGRHQMQLAKTWLKLEYKNKLGKTDDWASAIDQWPEVAWGADSIPRQTNDVDCGVFAVMYIFYITRNAVLNFTQANVPAFRELIAAWLREWQLH